MDLGPSTIFAAIMYFIFNALNWLHIGSPHLWPASGTLRDRTVTQWKMLIETFLRIYQTYLICYKRTIKRDDVRADGGVIQVQEDRTDTADKCPHLFPTSQGEKCTFLSHRTSLCCYRITPLISRRKCRFWQGWAADRIIHMDGGSPRTQKVTARQGVMTSPCSV